MLQFQNTLKVLKNPPQGFEKQVQLLISRIHDNDVVLDAGILAAFKFVSPYTLVSLSKDGLQALKIYLKEDLFTATKEGYKPHPVVKINQINAVDYLTSLVANNSDGYVEPHAD
ncbi:hypothetical protein NX059_009187 [Plenodomus lindquistii]|nr:hypothetical protein NX059_009187 [Plenodomus lindquistii]